MPHLIPVTRTGTTPEVTSPDAAKVISGNPIHTTWTMEDRGNIFAGLWHSTPGKWRIAYDEWEYFHILEGVSVITDATGQTTTLRAGDSWVIRPGFSGSWEVLDATLRDYVIVSN
jgi:uncharacterized protein